MRWAQDLGVTRVTVGEWTASEHHDGRDRPRHLWVITGPNNEHWRFWAGPLTGLRRFAHCIVKGKTNTLTQMTEGVPVDVDAMYKALLAEYGMNARVPSRLTGRRRARLD